MKAINAGRLLLITAIGLIAYVLIKKAMKLRNDVGQLQNDSKARIEAVTNNQYVTQTIAPVVNADKPVKFIRVVVPVGAVFDDILAQQAEESDRLQDCRIVEFHFDSDSLSNFYLISGYYAERIAQFL